MSGPESLSLYFDFTCEYSYGMWRWLERLDQGGTKLDVDWRPFVLKEMGRDDAAPSVFAGPTIGSVAVLALALAEAMRDDLAALQRYRSEVFPAMHDRDERPSREEIVGFAIAAGLDADSFWRDEALWLRSVRQSHEGAASRWGVFGTPTLVVDESRAMWLKLEDPLPDEDDLLRSIVHLTREFPQVAKLTRPNAPG